jgi:G3E family GTPase
MATGLQPLEKIYETPLTLAPLSVVLDARRALAALGGKKQRGSFHRDVGYVYRKQLEEAEWLVVNKIELLEESDREDLKERLAREFPGRRQFYLSAKTGEGVAVPGTVSSQLLTLDVEYCTWDRSNNYSHILNSKFD